MPRAGKVKRVKQSGSKKVDMSDRLHPPKGPNSGRRSGKGMGKRGKGPKINRNVTSRGGGYRTMGA